MNTSVFLFTPPFTQLNTPYPATAYLKGFLNTKNISSFQADLGIEITLIIFSKPGLQSLFEYIESSVPLSAHADKRESIYPNALSENANRIISLKEDYIQTIDDVILFLQGKNPTLAHLICKQEFFTRSFPFCSNRRPSTGIWLHGYTGQSQTPGYHVS